MKHLFMGMRDAMLVIAGVMLLPHNKMAAIYALILGIVSCGVSIYEMVTARA